MGLSARRDNILSFNRGFTSDASPVNFPRDFSLDEDNYDLDIDGTRRRRRGLSQDTANTFTSVVRASAERVRAFKWQSAANDTTANFVVVQLGRFIKFYTDLEDATVGAEKSFQIDLTGYKTVGTTDVEIDAQVVDMAVARGELIIVGTFMEPILVVYDAAGDNIAVSMIQLRERDLFGIEDGIGNTIMPVTDTTGNHRYNLLNQGWTDPDIAQFTADTGFFPSKNMVYGRAFRRQQVTGIADVDGTREYSTEKLIAELFQDAPSARGHLILNPFDTTAVVTSSTSASLYNVVESATLDFSFGTAFTIVTLTTTAAHGLFPSDLIFISGSGALFSYVSSIDGSTQSFGIQGGPYTVTTTPTGSTFTIVVDLSFVPGLTVFATLTDNFSTVSGSNVTTNSQGVITQKRPSAVAFFAGRIWYSGINEGKLTTKIYFSQVIETPQQFGKAYQVADPTDENISDLVATDGGTINIPEMGICYRLVPYSSGLLVFSFNGVWFVGPGSGGIFAADSYSIRKISEIGVDGPASIIMAENLPHYWARNSIYRIGQDSSGQGFLVAQNISIGRIDNFFNSLSTATRAGCQGAYDPLLKKIYWMYCSDPDDAVNPGFDKILLMDLKYNAYIKMSVPRRLVFGPGLDELSIGAVFATKTPNPTAPQTTIKFVTQRSADTIFTEFNATSPIDLDGQQEAAFIITGFDTGGVPSNRKQALYITVYSKKTETGYTEDEGDFIPVNRSSTIMQVRWDWADHINSGKWGPDQEVYRHQRVYTPANVDDAFNDGAPVVVTRNKVRGRGRSLHIKFSAGSSRHSHLLGWSTNYRILTEE
jgi:hypothetical protein